MSLRLVTVTGTVTHKSALRRVYGRTGGSWMSLDAIIRTEDGKSIKAYFSSRYENAFKEGDVVVAVGKKVRSGISVSSSGTSVKVTGHNRDYKPEEPAVQDTPDSVVTREFEIGYIRQPYAWGGKTMVSTKVNHQWLNIPIEVAREYFGTRWPGEWPSKGFGTLKALVAEEIGNNQSIVVHRILSWEPKTRTTHKTVALRDVLYRDGYIVVGGTTIRGQHLPFPSNSMINEIKSQFDGSLTIDLLGMEVMTGKWDKDLGRTVTSWEPAQTTNFQVSIQDDILARFTKEVTAAEQRRKFKEGIRLVKEIAKAKGKLVEFDELTKIAQAVSSAITSDDVKDAIWEPEYDERYFKRLAKYATNVYVWEQGFVFTYTDNGLAAAVVERPVASAATYVFNHRDFSGGIQEIIDIFNSFRLLDLRKGLNEDDNVDVAGMIGLVGVSMHTNIDAWESRVADMCMKAKKHTQPLADSYLKHVATMLGITTNQEE